MNSIKNNNLKIKQLLSWMIILLGLFAFLFFLNEMTVYLSDDFAYHFQFQKSFLNGGAFSNSSSPVRINGIISIIKSQYAHYFVMNGRIVAHFIVQFLLQFDKKIFNILNSIVFLLVAYIISLISKKFNNKKKVNLKQSTYLFIFFALWFLLPEFGASVLWVSGAGNYLWTSAIYLLFILFHICQRETNAFTVLFGSCLGLLTGNTNENSGPAAILIVLLLIWVRDVLPNHKIKLYQVLSILFAIIGFLFTILSPAPRVEKGLKLSLSIIFQNTRGIYNTSVQLFGFGYLILFVLLIIAVYSRLLKKESLQIIIIFLIGHFASMYSLVLSPERPLRVFFGSAIFLIIAIFITYYQILEFVPQRIINGLVAILSILFLTSFIYSARHIWSNSQEANSQINRIVYSQDKDVHAKIIHPISDPYNPYSIAASLKFDPRSWINQWEAIYYHVDSITGIPK